MGYTAYKLTEAAREDILKRFPPSFPVVKAEHITVAFDQSSDEPLPPCIVAIEVTGYSVDPRGIEALLVSIDGQTIRGDGSLYHITLSLDDRSTNPATNEVYQSVDSNRLIQSGPVVALAPFQIDAYPCYLERRPAPAKPVYEI
jgi:hypothetical protein